MKKITSEKQVNACIEKYKLQQFMKTNLREIAEIHIFRRDEYLIRADEASGYLYFLVNGKVICFSCTTNEKEECLGYYQGVTMIGEAASLWNKPPVSNVKALSECTCVAVSLRRHRDTLLNDLRFMQNVCYILAGRLNNEGRICDLLEPLDMRLAKFILQYAANDIFAFQLNDCAVILNTSYRHLLRVLKKFSAEGLIRKARNGYLVTDRASLKKIAGNLPATERFASRLSENPAAAERSAS
ncbi:MAG: cyclic nucleotide-binding domain-containing protein, partial [Clostridiales bacterium]|nr:cyclic nucleotide-binding domain-containing protein [Clostridiales bacterium]